MFAVLEEFQGELKYYDIVQDNNDLRKASGEKSNAEDFIRHSLLDARAKYPEKRFTMVQIMDVEPVVRDKKVPTEEEFEAYFNAHVHELEDKFRRNSDDSSKDEDGMTAYSVIKKYVYDNWNELVKDV